MGIRENEAGLVMLLFVHSFFVGMPRTLGNTVGLSFVSSTDLPFVLIAAAVISTVITLSLNRLQGLFSFSGFAYLNLGIQFISMTGFAVLLSLLMDTPNGSIEALIFYMWFQVIFILTYKQFWDLAGLVLDIRQSKRLFSFIGAGEFLFTIPVGIFATQIVNASGGAENLLWFAVIGIVGSTIVFSMIRRRYPTPFDANQRRRETRQQAPEITDIERPTAELRSYIFLISTLAAVYFFGFLLNRQLYFGGLDIIELGEGIDRRTSFALQLSAVMGASNLFLRLFVVDNYLSWLGVAGGLLILPVLVMFNSLALSGTFLFGETLFNGPIATADMVEGLIGVGAENPIGSLWILVWLMVALRATYGIIRPPIDRTAAQILYQPFPQDDRQRLLAVRDGIVEPVVGGLTGLLLLTPFLRGNYALQSYLLTGVVVVWFVIVWAVLRRYTTTVRDLLQNRHQLDLQALFSETANLQIVKRNLTSTDPTEALFAVHVLSELNDDSLREYVPNLLKHPGSIVRSATVGVVEKNIYNEYIPNVADLIDIESDINVKAAAVRALASLGDDDMFETFFHYAQSDDENIRANATVGLLQSGGLEGVVFAGNMLMAMADSDNPNEKRLAARIVGDLGNRSFYRLLVELINDDDDNVRRAAIIAAGKVRNPKLWPIVLENLYRSRHSVVRALSLADESVLPVFEEYFNNSQYSNRTLSTLVRICQRIGGPQVEAFLWDHTTHPESNVRRYVLETLVGFGFQATTSEERVACIEALFDEVEFLAAYLDILATLEPEPNLQLIVSSLRVEIEQAEARILAWLAFLFGVENIQNVRRQFNSNDPSRRALALEALEQIIDRDLRPLIIPIFESVPVGQKHQRLAKLIPVPEPRTAYQHLHDLIRDEQVDPWLRTTAIYAAAQLDDIQLADPISLALKDEHPMVVETAMWTISQIAPRLYQLYVNKRLQEAESTDLKQTIGIYRDTIGNIRKVQSGGESMLLTVEKVIMLKQAHIFSDVYEEFLAEIASQMREKKYAEQTQVYVTGDPATHLYIVTHGQVALRQANQTIRIVDEGETFGELELILKHEHYKTQAIAKPGTRVLTELKDHDLESYTRKLNNRPRKCLNYRTPAEVYHQRSVALLM